MGKTTAHEIGMERMSCARSYLMDVTRRQLPAGIELIEAPTPVVWIIGRVKTDGPGDYKVLFS